VKRTIQSKSILNPVLVMIVFLSACSAKAQPTNSPTQLAGDTPAATNQAPTVVVNPNVQQVIMSGVINKTYSPLLVYALSIDQGIVGIYLTEEDSSAITIYFPLDEQPGTYPIENRIGNSVVSVGAVYNYFGDKAAEYFSTKGNLILTAVGLKFSGTFQFTAADVTDPTQTIEVTGSFTDAQLNH